MPFNIELNPLMTFYLAYKTDIYPTLLFSSVLTNLLYSYVIHVDLIQPFCRFQLNIQQTACCFALHVLGWFSVDL